jgi:hypothetical protein
MELFYHFEGSFKGEGGGKGGTERERPMSREGRLSNDLDLTMWNLLLVSSWNISPALTHTSFPLCPLKKIDQQISEEPAHSDWRHDL